MAMSFVRNRIVFVVIFAAFIFLTAEAPSPWDIDGMVGKKAPNFTLRDLNGRNVALSSFRGRAVLINFWATWCPSCRSEMADLDRLGKDLKDKGLVVVGVSIDRSADYVKDYLEKHRVDFLLLMDPESKVSRQFKVFSLPTSFILDRNGSILYKFLGEEEWNSAEMRTKINKALGSQ
jgi:peroxiredoxin